MEKHQTIEEAQKLFQTSGSSPIYNTLVENLYLCSQECQTELDTILDLIPESWEINMNDTKGKILHNVFNNQWNQSCETNFREFIQSFIVN